jgi:Flp pilus assembly protein TadG
MVNDTSTAESRKARRNLRKERGQSLVELAFALPIFLVLLMGVIDFSWGLKSWISVTNAAREGARYGAVNCASANDSADLDGSGDFDADDVVQRALDTATGLGLTAGDVTVTNCTPGASGESVVVGIDYDYELVTPLGGLMSMFGGSITDSITLHSEGDMRIE